MGQGSSVLSELPSKTFDEDDARDSFLLYVWGISSKPDPSDDSPKGMHYVMDYVRAWLNSGNAVEVTAGSYETFLFVTLRIIDAWANDRRILDGKDPWHERPFERVLKGIFHPDRHHDTSPSKYEYEWKKFQLLKNYD